jgi:hypothetical protein
MAALTFYLPTVIFISLVGGFLPLLRELSQKALALPAQLQCRRASGRGLFSHAARDRQSSFRQYGLARVNRLSLNIGHGAVCLRPCLRGARP